MHETKRTRPQSMEINYMPLKEPEKLLRSTTRTNNRQRIEMSQLPNQGKARVRNEATFLFTSDHLEITKLISRLSGNWASRFRKISN